MRRNLSVMIAGLVAEYDRRHQQRTPYKNQQAEVNWDELIKVQRSIDRCLDFIAGGDGAMDTVRKTLAQLKISKATILASVEQVAPPVNVDNHPNIGHLYQRRIEQIVKLFSDEDTKQEAVTIIRSHIDRIDITQGESRGKPKVELIGGLGAILQLTISGHKKPPSKRIAVFVGS